MSKARRRPNMIRARRALGWGQKEAAAQFNITEDYYGRLERGIQDGSYALQLVMADTYGLSVEELLSHELIRREAQTHADTAV